MISFIYTQFVFSLSLIFPLMISGFLHMYIVKKNYFSFLNKPISIKLFGQNKTLRGFIVMPFLTYFGLVCTEVLLRNPFSLLSNTQILSLGLLLGFFYSLFELPNSWMKRKLNIQPGKTPEKNKLLFVIIDQTDSVVGCLIAYSFYLDLTWQNIIIVMLLGPSIHLAVNYLLFLLKLRKEPV